MRTISRSRLVSFVLVLAWAAAPAPAQGAGDPATGAPPGTPPPGDKQGPATRPGQIRSQPGTRTGADRPIPEGCWFEKVHLSFGSYVENGGERLLEGTYPFRNPTKTTQQIKGLTPSCKCQRLRLFVAGREVTLARKNDPDQSLEKPIDVPPGAKGKLVLQFDVAGAAGHRTGDIRVDTTDPAMPTYTLTCEAEITPAFAVDPAVILLGEMGPTEQKRWSCKVHCLVRKDWKVDRAAPPLPQGLAVSEIKRVEDGGEIHYEIRGTYGPDLEEGAVGGNLLFTTDDPAQNFMVEIRADVREKVRMTPRFFSFNSFPRNRAQEKTLYLWPSNAKEPDAAIHVDRVEVTTCTVDRKFVSFEIVPPAKRAPNAAPELIKIHPHDETGIPADKLWKILVRVRPDLPGRLLRVKAKVHLAGPGMVPKAFQFNGFPRAPRREP